MTQRTPYDAEIERLYKEYKASKELSLEEARARLYRVARTPKGRCPRCKTDISPGNRYYLTYSESIKQHPVHLSCKEAPNAS